MWLGSLGLSPSHTLHTLTHKHYSIPALFLFLVPLHTLRPTRAIWVWYAQIVSVRARDEWDGKGNEGHGRYAKPLKVRCERAVSRARAPETAIS